MTITVQKQVEETVEVQTPCYYETISGYQYINNHGQIISVSCSMIYMWEQSKEKHYTNEIQSMLKHGKPCSKEEFDKAYAATTANISSAVGCMK